MKKLFAIFIVCLSFFGSPAAWAVTVSPGNPLTLIFSPLPFVGTSYAYCCQSGASVYLAGNVLDAGDDIRLSFYGPGGSGDGLPYWDFNDSTWGTPSNVIGAG